MSGILEVVGHVFEALFGMALIVLPVIFVYLIIRRAISGGLRTATARGVEQLPRKPDTRRTLRTR